MEQGMSESGTGDGVEKRDWLTSSSLQERGARKLKDLGNVLLTGNRQLEIGKAFNQRYQRFASSKMDGDTGVFDRRVKSEKELLQVEQQQFMSLFDYDEQQQIIDLGLGVKGERVARSAVAWFFSVFFVRKPLVMITNLLNIAPRYEMHVTCMSWKIFKQSWLQLTENLRRVYLSNSDDAERFINGACNSSGIFPNWLRTIAINSIQRNTGLVRTEKDCRKTLPLYRIVEESVASLIYSPITLTCILNSLYHVTAFTSLDVNVMALCCYLLRTMEWYEHCPLHVLALAARGAELLPEQQQQYDRFAERLLPLTSCESRNRGPQPSGNAWLMHAGQIELCDSQKDALLWARFSSSSLTDEQRAKIGGQFNARTLPSKRKMRTHWVRSLQQWITYETPAWIDEKVGRTQYENSRMSNATIIASELFAEQQSQAAHDVRLQRKQNNVRFSAPALWSTICAGTGLQVGGDDNHDNTQDRFFPTFESPHEQGFFYRDAISRVGSASTLMANMLLMFGLPPTTTRQELVQAVLKPYIQKRNLEDQLVWFSNKYWAGGVVNSQPQFQWGALPFIPAPEDFFAADHRQDGQGIEGMETFLGMSIEMLLVSQALYTRDWWHSNPAHWKQQRLSQEPHFANVHLRLMAYASETILSMLVHNHVELAALPVFGKNKSQSCIRLYASSADNYASNGSNAINAHIIVDKRLHRSSQHDVTLQHLCLLSRALTKITCREMPGIKTKPRDKIDVCQEPGVIGVQSLFETQWMLFIGETISAVTESGTGMAVSDVFSMPPESVYHMHTQFDLMRRAHSTLLKQSSQILDIHDMDNMNVDDVDAVPEFPNGSCDISRSMLNVLHASIVIFGQSTTVSMLRFIPLTLTELVVEQEIPCVTWRGGFMFVMKTDEIGNMTLFPVHPTHNVWLECEYSYNLFMRQNKIATQQRESGEPIAPIAMWKALPLLKRKVQFPATINMQLFTTYGLTQCEEGIRVDLDVDNYERDVEKKIPFTPYPVLFFPALLWLELKHEIVHGDDNELYAVLMRQEYFEQLQRCNFFRDIQFSRNFLLKNKDIVLPRGHDLYIAPNTARCLRMTNTNSVNDPYGRNFFFAVVHVVAGSKRHYYFYNTRAELKAAYAGNISHDFALVVHEHYKDQVLKNIKNTALCCNELDVHTIYQKPSTDASNDSPEVLICAFEYDDSDYWLQLKKMTSMEERVKNFKNILQEKEEHLANVQARRHGDEVLRYGDDENMARSDVQQAQSMLQRWKSELELCTKNLSQIGVTNLGQQVQYIQIVDMRDHAPVFAGPRTINMACVTETIGMIVPTETSKTSAQWLKNGHYHVRYLDHQASTENMPMDFVTASACIIAEGKRCWLQVDDAMLLAMQESFRDQCQSGDFQKQGISTSSFASRGLSLSTVALRYIQSMHESTQQVLLQVFPVLGALPEKSDSFADQYVHVAVRARDAHGKMHTFKLYVPLFMQASVDSYKRMPYLKQIAGEHAHIEMHVLLT